MDKFVIKRPRLQLQPETHKSAPNVATEVACSSTTDLEEPKNVIPVKFKDALWDIGLFMGPGKMVLQKMGVGDLFQDSADFSTLTEEKVSLGNALHKARIEINEEGTKAAAATVLFSFRSSRPAEPAQFKCDHPFVYIIYDKIDQSVLFTGVFRRPY